jgi:hypothetical protein
MTRSISPVRPALDIDDLDRAITKLSTRINAATYELLVLIRQFDERAGWLKWGFLNCADWLHWRCDLSIGAAREKVRVAHSLKVLPAIARAFRLGKLSYSKVRALARVATRDNEVGLLGFALKTTAARVEERCRELRCATVESIADANRAHAKRSLTLRRDPDRDAMTITVELPIEAGELIDKALDKARDDAPNPEFVEESWAAGAVPGCRSSRCGVSRATATGLFSSTTPMASRLAWDEKPASCRPRSKGRSGRATKAACSRVAGTTASSTRTISGIGRPAARPAWTT